PFGSFAPGSPALFCIACLLVVFACSRIRLIALCLLYPVLLLLLRLACTFEMIDPATEEVLATVAEGRKENVDLAVKAVREAFDNGPVGINDIIRYYIVCICNYHWLLGIKV
ncbi:aldehyde dehydrogenase family 2 member C4-like protein, partial [Tanacetum coccineum]